MTAFVTPQINIKSIKRITMFDTSKMDEAKQAQWFGDAHKCVVERLAEQYVGCARDYQIVKLLPGSPLDESDLHQYIEFKFDKAAAKTSNLYLEYEQTFNHGRTFSRSGMSIAVEQSKYIVYSVPYSVNVRHYVFRAGDMKEFLKLDLRKIRTRSRANGNKMSSWSRGLLLPMNRIDARFIQIEHTSAQT